jgi:hypothetical protein
MYKAAAMLSVSMKVYIIPGHDRCHINVMVVLQSCRDTLRVLPSLSSETFPTSSDCMYDVGSMKVEENVAVIEECFVAVKKGADTGIKQEEIPEDITFPGIKSEPDEVSYVCICLLLDTFYHFPEMSIFLFL